MAKTLFFLEALALALLGIALPIIAADAASAFVIPLAASALMPLACAAAVWPPKIVLAALRAAFSPRPPSPSEAGRLSRVLASLAGFSRAAAALGLCLSLAAVARR